MLTRLRFGLYRKILSSSNAKGFKGQDVWPLEAPQEQLIKVESVAPELPRLKRAKIFPISEHAKKRFRRIRISGLLFPLITGIPARNNAPIADNLAELLEQICPKGYRDAKPEPPVLLPELEADDILAALARTDLSGGIESVGQQLVRIDPTAPKAGILSCLPAKPA